MKEGEHILMDEDHDLNSTVATLAGVLGSPHFPRGDLAELRRMKTTSYPLAFWRILSDYVPDELRLGDSREEEWAVIVNGMAIMAPNIHSPAQIHAVGAVFSTFPQGRIMHFLRSKGDNLVAQIRLLARLCTSKNTPIDWTTLTWLLFAGEKAENTRRKVAKEYVRAIAAHKKEAQK